jgi:hypothetical protein
MSRSKSRRKRQNKVLGIPGAYLPLIGAFAGIALIGVVAAVVELAKAAAYRPEVTGEPAIEVAETSFDLGDVELNTQAEVTYEIRNVGDQPLRIVETPQVEVLEGC